MERWPVDLSSTDWEEVSHLFELALEDAGALESAPLRIRIQVENLVRLHTSAGRFLETPPLAPGDFLIGDGDPPNVHAGRLLVGRYYLERELGRGGAGAVYLARDRRLHDRPVVIKLLHPHWLHSTWMRVRFRQESEVLSRMRRPDIVEILDFGESEGGECFLVMTYREGMTLREAVSKQRLETGRAVQILWQVAEALEAAHAQGILHRDLKPENVLLACAGDSEQAVLLDFGIAKLSAPGDLETTTFVIGTTDYMAPEQFRGKSSVASDVYSLAVVAHELLTGTLPFDPLDLRRSDVKLRKLASRPLRKVFARALDGDPHLRPASPTALCREIDEALNHTGVSRRTIAVAGTAVACSSLLGWDWFNSRSLEATERRIEYSGAQGLERVGFTSSARVSPALDIDWVSEMNDARNGTDRIRFISHNQGYFFKPLTRRQRTQALARGWRLTVVSQCTQGAMSCDVDLVAKRFDMDLVHTPEDGYSLFLNTQISPRIMAQRIRLEGGAGAYHRYEMVYEPSLKTAHVSVDGVRRAFGYQGHAQYCYNRGLIFGTEIRGSAAQPASGILKSFVFEIFA